MRLFKAVHDLMIDEYTKGIAHQSCVKTDSDFCVAKVASAGISAAVA
jgi:hypothetical protein